MSRKITPPRKIWRMSANAPLGEILDSEAIRQVAASRARPLPRAIESPTENDWQSSSFALLSGLEVKDYTSRIPVEVFDRLFKD
jgi:hypothetical protein